VRSICICSILKDVVSGPDYISKNERVIVNNELQMMRNDPVVAYFEVLSRNLTGGDEEKQETLQPRYSASRPRFKPGFSRIRVRRTSTVEKASFRNGRFNQSSKSHRPERSYFMWDEGAHILKIIVLALIVQMQRSS
jgi:hypothetical protein